MTEKHTKLGPIDIMDEEPGTAEMLSGLTPEKVAETIKAIRDTDLKNMNLESI